MARKSVWFAVLAAGALAMGCSSNVANVSPGGTGGALLGAGWSAPNAYQYQADVLVGKTMNGSDAVYGLGFTYFFKAVEDTDKPFALQEFYQAPGYVSASVSDLSDAGNSWSVVGEYWIQEKKLAINAAVAAGTVKDIAFGLGVAYKINEDLEASLDYSMEDGDNNNLGIGAEYVLGVGGKSLDLGLNLGLVKDTGNSGLLVNFSADYYLLKELGLGVVVENQSGDIGSATNYGVQASYYTGPLSLQVGYMINDGSANTLAASVGYRF